MSISTKKAKQLLVREVAKWVEELPEGSLREEVEQGSLVLGSHPCRSCQTLSCSRGPGSQRLFVKAGSSERLVPGVSVTHDRLAEVYRRPW